MPRKYGIAFSYSSTAISSAACAIELMICAVQFAETELSKRFFLYHPIVHRPASQAEQNRMRGNSKSTCQRMVANPATNPTAANKKPIIWLGTK